MNAFSPIEPEAQAKVQAKVATSDDSGNFFVGLIWAGCGSMIVWSLLWLTYIMCR